LLQRVEKSIEIWLDNLTSCSIDLEEYGRQVQEEYEKVFSNFNFRMSLPSLYDIPRDRWESVREDYTPSIRLLGFQYGPKSSSWKLWWSEPTDALVVEFWNLVDGEVLNIPGSWNKD